MKTILFLLLASISTANAETPAETKEFDSKDLRELDIESTAGRITVSAAEGSKASVTATKKKFSDKCKLKIEREGSKLEIELKHSGIMSNESCEVDFGVRVPKLIDLEISHGAGKVETKGTQGKLDFKVGAGDVRAEGAFTAVEGKSGAGSVEIKWLAAPKGEADLKSGAGSITLLFPKGSKVRTDFKSGVGRLENQLGDSPSPELQLKVKTGAGGLKIVGY